MERGRKSQKLSLKGRWSHSWPLSWAKGQSAQGGQKATGRCQRGVRFLPETGGGGPWEPGQQVLTSPVAQGTGAGAGDRTIWGIMEWKSKVQSLREADRLRGAKGTALDDLIWAVKRPGPHRTDSEGPVRRRATEK